MAFWTVFPFFPIICVTELLRVRGWHSRGNIAAVQYRTPIGSVKQQSWSRLNFLCENGCVLR